MYIGSLTMVSKRVGSGGSLNLTWAFLDLLSVGVGKTPAGFSVLEPALAATDVESASETGLVADVSETDTETAPVTSDLPDLSIDSVGAVAGATATGLGAGGALTWGLH